MVHFASPGIDQSYSVVIAVEDGYADAVLYTAQRMEVGDVAELARLFEGKPKESLAATHEGVDLQRDNNIRAGWAARALIAYANHLGDQSLVEELETVTGDLLGDLLHLFDALGLDWEEIRERGERFHREEVLGDV
ncbi:hypothetical protein E3G68_005347 [Mycobacteroides abscessus]|uniref:hypothetical protein n=1 Tax=Mycobacteroides abscessus TaxID=36809 RepID=UPI001C65A584|nr:hypothetical protein [Mycobacteroides abscessus]